MTDGNKTVEKGKMTAKEFLNRYRMSDRIIKVKQIQLEELRSMAESMGGLSDGERVQSSGNPDKISGKVARIIDLEDEIQRSINKALNVKREIMGIIDQIENPDTLELLYMRYLSFKTWVEIAYTLNVSYQWVHELHGKALKKIDHLIEVDSRQVV